MRAVVVAVVALIGGFLAGIVLSEVIGVVGLLVFEDVVGIKFLPVVTALVAAAAAVVVNLRSQRRSGMARRPGDAIQDRERGPGCPADEPTS